VCNCHEGYIAGALAFSVEGMLCVTDLRASRASNGIGENFVPPSHYRITSIENGKQIAKDLLEGKNTEIHEANKQEWIKKNEATAKLMAGADKLIEELKLKNEKP
jgi:hypothetical protein